MREGREGREGGRKERRKEGEKVTEAHTFEFLVKPLMAFAPSPSLFLSGEGGMRALSTGLRAPSMGLAWGDLSRPLLEGESPPSALTKAAMVDYQ